MFEIHLRGIYWGLIIFLISSFSFPFEEGFNQDLDSVGSKVGWLIVVVCLFYGYYLLIHKIWFTIGSYHQTEVLKYH